MKKMSTLILAGLIALSASAFPKHPQVILNTANNYDVKIDGRIYRENSADLFLKPGTHTIEVYRTGGFFGNRKTFISSSQFTVYNNDVMINVNRDGYTNITEARRWDDRGNRGDNRTGWNDNNRGSGAQNYPGNGNQYDPRRGN